MSKQKKKKRIKDFSDEDTESLRSRSRSRERNKETHVPELESSSDNDDFEIRIPKKKKSYKEQYKKYKRTFAYRGNNNNNNNNGKHYKNDKKIESFTPLESSREMPCFETDSPKDVNGYPTDYAKKILSIEMCIRNKLYGEYRGCNHEKYDSNIRALHYQFYGKKSEKENNLRNIYLIKDTIIDEINNLFAKSPKNSIEKSIYNIYY